MHSHDLHRALPSLFRELIHGVRGGPGYILNPGDLGLLESLDQLSADEASHSVNGGATVAAHVDHLRYGLSLMNRWSEGEQPFEDADWSQAWNTGAVDDTAWAALRTGLRAEAERWEEALAMDREVSGLELNGVIASVVHLAYHLGAMRQIAKGLRGPQQMG